MFDRTRVRTFRSAFLVLAIAVMATPAPAEAGCLSERNACMSCARRDLWRSIIRLDLRGIQAANIDLWDCDIDLYHCVFLGQHHSYPCAAV